MVKQLLQGFLADPLRVSAELGEALRVTEGLADKCSQLADRVGDTASFTNLLHDLGARIILGQDSLSLLIDPTSLLSLLSSDGPAVSEAPITITIEVQMRRRGHELKLVYTAPEARPAARDNRLIQLLGRAQIAYQTLRSGKAIGAARQHIVRLARLHFLAPDIVTAILEGRQPVELNARALLRVAELPAEWDGQRRVLGFA